MFSAYYLSEQTAKTYVEALKKSRIEWIHGYPSILALLSVYMIDQRINPIDSMFAYTSFIRLLGSLVFAYGNSVLSKKKYIRINTR